MVGMSPALYSTAQPEPRRQSVCTQSLASRLYLTLLVTTIPRSLYRSLSPADDLYYISRAYPDGLPSGSTPTGIIIQYISSVLLPASYHPHCAPREAHKAPLDSCIPVCKGLSRQDQEQYRLRIKHRVDGVC